MPLQPSYPNGAPQPASNLIHTLRQRYPGFWASLNDQQRARIRRIAQETGALHPKKFFQAVTSLRFFQAWQDTQATEGGDDEKPPVDEGPQAPGTQPGDETPADTPAEIDTDVRDMLVNFLTENQLPSSLIGFITNALAQHESFDQIVAELRQTPEYKAAYPENDIRLANGMDWIPESQIRGLRSEIRRLANEYLGVGDVGQDEINNVIGKGWSLATWERKLQRYQEFERWGPTVKTVLEQELGHSISDERLYAFFDDTPTPELDTAYERALLRGQPAILGLGVRPEAEAEMLRKYGISVEQAFAGYQKLAQELPAVQRFSLIENQIGRQQESFPTGNELFNDTPFATLFRAIQLGDADAIATLQGQMAREVARFQGQGGAAQSQGGASVGLLSEEERNL